MTDADSLQLLLADFPPASLPAAMARIVAEATVVAGATVSTAGQSALAALANGEPTDLGGVAALQTHYLHAETLAWQAFLTGDTVTYLRRFRAARALGALYHATAQAPPHAIGEVIREAAGTGLPLAVVEEVLRDYSTLSRSD